MDPRKIYGLEAVPHSQSELLKAVSPWDPASYTTSELLIPESEVVTKTLEYVKVKLPEKTFNHSMRVFYYGSAIAHKHLPSFVPSLETYFLTCLLHDIGTTEENLNTTRLSFEFYGGYLALDLLKGFGAPQDQAESVAEAIIRHQDFGNVGKISTVGQLIQLSTVFDNVGINPTLVSKKTIESVVNAFPRDGWSSCFATTIGNELQLKPWAHTSAISGAADAVENNQLMKPWDK